MKFAAVIITLFGILCVARPGLFAGGRDKFHHDDPLVHLAQKKQPESRNGFIIALGIIFIIVGIAGFVM